MSYLTTIDDLRADALWRAGEPQDSSSSFWSKSLDYMNRIQRQLVIGGSIAVGRDLATSAGIYAHLVGLPITDWMWARKVGVLSTLLGINGATVTVSTGSVTATISSAPAISIEGWRIQIANLPTVPLIKVHSGTTLTLDQPWPEASQTSASCVIFQPEYPLPEDFVRFATPPYAHTYRGQPLSVGTREQRHLNYPWTYIIQGMPTSAFLTGPQTLQINTWDTRQYRMEFEYIGMPPDLTVNQEPIVPFHQRAVLSTGAAMLMSFDKNDGRTENIASEYREWVASMVQEHRRALTGGSLTFGVFKTRQPTYVRRSPQPLGEMFLI